MKRLSNLAVSLLVGAFSFGAIDTQATKLGESEQPGSCTFTISGVVDGTPVNVTITVTDVNAVECALMKAAAKKAAEQPKK